MKCPGCGYVSFDLLETCKQCGTPMVASAAYGMPAATPPPEAAAGADLPLPDDLQSLRLVMETGSAQAARAGGAGRRRSRPARAPRMRSKGEGQAGAPFLDDELRIADAELEAPTAGAAAASVARDGGPAFCIDEELFPDGTAAAGTGQTGAAPFSLDPPGGEERLLASFCDPGAAGVFHDEEGAAGEAGPIINRDEEVPERFWAPEVAGLGRRGLALVLDQAFLGALLGVFFLGAYAALRFSGFEADALFAAAGLQAALPPFALLAALLSLAYHVFFHGRDGRTPGKALVGVEVRTGDGAVPSVGRSALRWFAAALGFSCAGAGVAWALFHPRRCGWADLLSATLIAERRRPTPGVLPRR